MQITRIYANTANDDTNKNKLKTQNYKYPPEADPPSEEKVKTLMISSHCEEQSDEAIHIVPLHHCELRSFVNLWTSDVQRTSDVPNID
jgi:hypothetical protein